MTKEKYWKTLWEGNKKKRINKWEFKGSREMTEINFAGEKRDKRRSL